MKNIALIVAAGRGSRASSNGAPDIPKQYVPLAGIPVLRYTIEKFASHPEIDHILVVIHPDDRDLYASCVEGIDKLLPVVEGAATRQGSVQAGLSALVSLNPDNVLIHDAARPLLSHALIDRVLNALIHDIAIVPALAITDTMKKNDKGYVGASISRDQVASIQTPQGFVFSKILEAHERAKQTGNDNLTDDSAIAVQAGMKVRIVEGEQNNLKITMEPDFDTALRLLALRNSSMITTTGTGFDVHKFGHGDHVTLCGVDIPHNQGLSGHSDADVGLHALVDAILGALGDGDIGSHFPPSDPQWKGAASSLFLEHAAGLVSAQSGMINHVDVTLICEGPKIGPHRDAMRQHVADILEIPVAKVSIKATTTEGLGFTGRGEGIAAQAIATLSLPDIETDT